MAQTATRNKTTYFIDAGNNKVCRVKAVKSAVSDIVNELGWTESATGELPDGKTLVGRDRNDAVLNGCFPLAIYYTKNKKEQRAVVLVSPTKADTAASALKNKKYSGHNISEVRPVRRRKFTIY